MFEDEILTSLLDNSYNVETNLWKSVIMQAILDLFLISSRTEFVKARLEAATWFNLANEDFLMVCSFAECCPRKIIKLARKIKNSKDKSAIQKIRVKLTRKYTRNQKNHIPKILEAGNTKFQIK